MDSKCDPETADIQINSTGGTSPYSYNLVGVGTNNTGYYQDVPAGTYTFKVKASDLTGNTVAEKNLTLTITPPWWLAIWAKALWLSW